MEQHTLGNSDLTISRLGLGTATWGATTDREDAADQLKAFADAGGTLVDTADIYVGGNSEQIIGELLGNVISRSDIVLATKAAGQSGGDTKRVDASRGHLLEALDASLRRMRTDHVDLWQLHAWDKKTPLEETLSAIDTAVSSGRARHAGICNYSGWQTAKAATLQKTAGHTPLVSCQAEYSLLQRGVEREVVPAAEDSGMALLAWAPLGRGVLTGKYRKGVPDERAKSRFFKWYVAPRLGDRSADIVEEVATAADELGVSPLTVSLAWVMSRPLVAAPLVGARSVDQLRESLDAHAKNVVLDDEILRRLDDVSRPHVDYPESGI